MSVGQTERRGERWGEASFCLDHVLMKIRILTFFIKEES
jgi:hypothetical protein